MDIVKLIPAILVIMALAATSIMLYAPLKLEAEQEARDANLSECAPNLHILVAKPE